MRYYEVREPDQEVKITSRVKSLKDLPEGTLIAAVITDRGGSPLDSYSIPVVNGKPVIRRRAVKRAKAVAGL